MLSTVPLLLTRRKADAKRWADGELCSLTVRPGRSLQCVARQVSVVHGVQATLTDTAAGNREFALVTFFFTVTRGTLPKEIALHARIRALER